MGGKSFVLVVARKGFLSLMEVLGKLRNPRGRPREPTALEVFLEVLSSNLEVGFGILFIRLEAKIYGVAKRKELEGLQASNKRVFILQKIFRRS